MASHKFLILENLNNKFGFRYISKTAKCYVYKYTFIIKQFNSKLLKLWKIQYFALFFKQEKLKYPSYFCIISLLNYLFMVIFRKKNKTLERKRSNKYWKWKQMLNVLLTNINAKIYEMRRKLECAVNKIKKIIYRTWLIIQQSETDAFAIIIYCTV